MIVAALNLSPSLFSLRSGKPLCAGVLRLPPVSLLPSQFAFACRKGLGSRLRLSGTFTSHSHSVRLRARSLAHRFLFVAAVLISIPVVILVMPMILAMVFASTLGLRRDRQQGGRDQRDRQYQRRG